MVKMGTVWDRTAEFISDNLGVILPIALISFFVPASIEGNFPAARDTASAGLELVLSLISVAFALLSLWGTLALIAMAADANATADAGNVARRRLLPALAVWIALMLVLFVLFLGVPLLLALGGQDPGLLIATGDMALDLPPALAWAVALYCIALVLFLIWAAARLMPLSPLIVHERRMFDAIRRSFALTRGHVLAIVGVLLLFLLMLVVARSAALWVFGSIFRLIAGGEDGVTLAGVLTSVTVAAVQTAFAVIAAVFQAKLYVALVSERERAVSPA
ncbi:MULTISPECIES: hypothetical protein [unclassified Sphingosinithalassobacter]|uniref:hypothetical protein n=1 Tax=unclassified Sphingosinithalassobacter TaxID=2676235 RepID=UPI00165DE60F|nr:hypothetical protein [Sphingosinithalassobacter sp. CS137]